MKKPRFSPAPLQLIQLSEPSVADAPTYCDGIAAGSPAMRDYNPTIVAAISVAMITTNIHATGANVDALRTCRTS